MSKQKPDYIARWLKRKAPAKHKDAAVIVAKKNGISREKSSFDD